MKTLPASKRGSMPVPNGVAGRAKMPMPATLRRAGKNLPTMKMAPEREPGRLDPNPLEKAHAPGLKSRSYREW